MECFKNCTESDSGGVCDPCPEFFEGDGVTCEDLRMHCHVMDCYGSCSEMPSGGVCDPCPEGFFGNGTVCTEIIKELTCDDLKSRVLSPRSNFEVLNI